MRLILDTSFLMNAMEGKIDIMSELRKFGEPKLSTLDLVVKELEGFSVGRGRNARNAKLSLGFIKNEGVRVIKAGGKNTDNNIVSYAGNRKMDVCTTDAELKKTLMRRGVGVVTIRQGRYLVKPPKL
jgi:rRNA-processing protein FCF1